MIDKLGNDAAIAMAEELAEDLGPCAFIVGAKLNDHKCVLAAKKLSFGLGHALIPISFTTDIK